ncbi:toprim domain-containing protein [Acidithiobacillus sp. MC6.1]|nr:toprim domain-containing protein [Acidithiobacillus sp. MC6.1]
MGSYGGGIGNDDRLFERAKQSMALSDFLVGFLGENPKKAGGHYRFDSCPHCGEGHSERLVVFLPENTSYFCHKCGAKGSIIDVAMIAQNLSSPLQAAKFLLGETDMASQQQTRRTPRAPAKAAADVPDGKGIKPVILGLLKMSGNSRRDVPAPVADYLQSRGLSTGTIQEAWKRKFFLALDGESRQIAGGVMKVIGKQTLADHDFINEKGMVKIIPYRPLVFPLSHTESAEFRLIRAPRDGELKAITKGSKNHDMWFWKGEQGNTEAMIVEGAIDLLSVVEMRFKGTIFGLPGVTGFGDGSRIVAGLKAIQCSKVWMVLDNDDAGAKATAKLCGILKASGFDVTPLKHEDGCNDLNDILVKRQAKSTTQPVQVATETALPATPVAPVVSTAPVAPVEAPTQVTPKPKKPRAAPGTAKPRASRKKQPLSVWGRIKLAAKVLMEGRP